MHNLFCFFLLWDGNSLPQQRDRCTDLSLVSAHPSPDTPSLSLALSPSLRIPRIPLRLWHLPHTTWFDEGNSLEHAFRERENGPKKFEGDRETKSFAVSANNWQLKIIQSYQTDTHTCHEQSLQEAKNNTDPLCPIFRSASSDSLFRFLLNLCS